MSSSQYYNDYNVNKMKKYKTHTFKKLEQENVKCSLKSDNMINSEAWNQMTYD